MKERQRIAEKRIGILLNEAKKAAKESEYMLAKRYVYLARKMGMKHRVKLPDAEKHWVCKRCNSYLIPGSNCRIRIKKNWITIVCESCGSQRRIWKDRDLKKAR